MLLMIGQGLPRTRFDGQWKHMVHWTLEGGRENGKAIQCGVQDGSRAADREDRRASIEGGG